MEEGGYDHTPILITDAVHHKPKYEKINKIAQDSLLEIAEIVSAMKDAEGAS